MKRLLILTVLCAAIHVLAQKDGTKVFPFEVRTTQLKNGMKAILIPFDSPGIVAYYTVVRTGSRDEWEPGKSGFAHFFEHMMFRGTKRFPGNVYDSIVTGMGADANAYTDDDLTVYHMKVASKYLETVMDIESDRFRNLAYSKEQFQTESGAVYGEYRKGRTNPWEVAYESFREMAFDKHTYKHTTIGFEKDIKEMPNMYEYSLSFYKRYYRPSNVVVLIVGDVNVESAPALLEKYYGPWSGEYVAPQIEQEPAQKKARAREVRYEGKTLPLILLGYKNDAFDVRNMNLLALQPFAELCFGETSLLYKKLVLEEQKVQFINANPGFARDPYLFEISVMVKSPKDVDYVLDEIRKAIAGFKKNLTDNKVLNELKRRLKYQFLMSLDNADAIAGYLPRFITITGDITVVDDLYRNIERLTPKDIQGAVYKYFTPEKENLIILKGAE